MKATQSGSLVSIEDKCTIIIPGFGPIPLNNLPDISDTKSAVYNNEGIIGRATPLYTYSHSGDRNINMQLHFFVVDKGSYYNEDSDAIRNISYLQAIQSACYPQLNGSLPYKPPPICKIKCGEILSSSRYDAYGEWICAVLQSYSVRFPTEVAWDEETFCPYRFDVDTSWLVVYSSDDLPENTRIIGSGR
jgi:hypothetical protein